MKVELKKTLTVKCEPSKPLDKNSKVLLWEKLKGVIGNEFTGCKADYGEFDLHIPYVSGGWIRCKGSWMLK